MHREISSSGCKNRPQAQELLASYGCGSTGAAARWMQCSVLCNFLNKEENLESNLTLGVSAS